MRMSMAVWSHPVEREKRFIDLAFGGGFKSSLTVRTLCKIHKICV